MWIILGHGLPDTARTLTYMRVNIKYMTNIFVVCQICLYYPADMMSPRFFSVSQYCHCKIGYLAFKSFELFRTINRREITSMAPPILSTIIE